MKEYLKHQNAEIQNSQRIEEEEEAKEKRDQMICSHLRLVFRIAHRYSLSREEQEEYVSVGTIGLIKAVDSFDPEKAFCFSTYAGKCIENEIRMMRRKNRKNCREYGEISLEMLEQRRKIEKTQAEPDAMERIEQRALLTQAMEQLTQREREILICRYGLFQNVRQTQAEAARRFGISQSYLSRMEKSAYGKLQSTLIHKSVTL